MFNPAVAISGAGIGLFAWPTLWAYLLAQIVASAAAGLTFLALNPDDKYTRGRPDGPASSGFGGPPDVNANPYRCSTRTSTRAASHL